MYFRSRLLPPGQLIAGLTRKVGLVLARWHHVAPPAHFPVADALDLQPAVPHLIALPFQPNGFIDFLDAGFTSELVTLLAADDFAFARLRDRAQGPLLILGLCANVFRRAPAAAVQLIDEPFDLARRDDRRAG